MRNHRSLARLAAAAALAALTGTACHDNDTAERSAPAATLGESLFEVFCDRVGAQSLPEDVVGASYRNVCHRNDAGAFADDVDTKRLDVVRFSGVDKDGKAVSPESIAATRHRGIARVEALARRRTELITALDAALPDVANQDSAGACKPATGQENTHAQLGELLHRLVPLYNEGLLPRSTQTLAHWFAAIAERHDAQAALARFDGRQGYRPAADAMGVPRALLGYPRLRDLGNALLAVVGPDSSPYDLYAELDELDRATPVPGPAYRRFEATLAAGRAELAGMTADPYPGALSITADPVGGNRVLSRPRTGPEALAEVLFAKGEVPENATLGSRYVVRRDGRGYAMLAGAVAAPFTDADGDGQPDVDALGRFVTTGSAVAVPFVVPGTVKLDGADARDPEGRALAANGKPLFQYGETMQSFGAAVLRDTRGFLGVDETPATDGLSDLLMALPVLLGERDGEPTRTKSYTTDQGPLALRYDGFKPETSPLMDLTYALGQAFGDSTMPDTLALVRTLVAQHGPELARVTGALLEAKAIADRHPEATLSGKSTFWDEMIDVAVEMGKVPGLLEDTLAAVAEDDVATLGPAFAAHLSFKDRVSYDRNKLNGPAINVTTGLVQNPLTPVDRAAPDTGDNRSGFQRVLHLLNDTEGVALCNRDKAVIHGWAYLSDDRVEGSEAPVDLPLQSGPVQPTYRQCEFLKIDNLGRFYLDAIVGRAELYFREPLVQLATDVRLQEKTSGMVGFWDPPTAQRFRPTPLFLNRQAFFDQATDSPVAEPAASNPNYVTNHFLRDFIGPHIGTAVCDAVDITDPLASSPDRAPDGMVRNLRKCKEGDWLDQRHPGTAFLFEQLGYLKGIAPLVKAAADHGREDLFVKLMTTLHRHWQSDKGTKSECDPSAPKTSARYCTQDGLVRYEPLLAEVFASDLVPALRDLMKVVRGTSVLRCTATDATGACAASESVPGVNVLAEATRALTDPARSKAQGLVDRIGRVTAARNDGTTNAQVTPIYLLTQALAAVDAAFDKRVLTDPQAKARLGSWRNARSRLVDELFSVEGKGAETKFRHSSLLLAAPVLVDVLSEQLRAHCPAGSTAACSWAKVELPKNVEDLLTNPLTPAALDLADAVRKDDKARAEVRKLLLFLLDPQSKDAPLPSLLAAIHDLPQLLGDEQNLAAMMHAVAPAMDPPGPDAPDGTAQGGMMEAQLLLLSRLTGRAYHADGTEDCDWEVDPNGVLPVALRGFVTSAASLGGRAPLEVVLDVIADVNRVDPASNEKLEGVDYASMAESTMDFLLNRERGLEQFYEVIWRGTRRK